MPRSFFSPVFLVLVSCGPGKAALDAAATAALLDIPDDVASCMFARRLLKTTVTGWSPSSGGAVSIRYNSLTFGERNAWRADAVVSVFDDETPCAERGTWTLQPAKSEFLAALDLTVDETTCPDRSIGHVMRVEAALRADGGATLRAR